MHWLRDIPYDVRLTFYNILCQTTPLTVHNFFGGPKFQNHRIRKCSYVDDEEYRHRTSTIVALLMSCRTVNAELEEIFFTQTSFIIHQGCFGWKRHTPICLLQERSCHAGLPLSCLETLFRGYLYPDPNGRHRVEDLSFMKRHLDTVTISDHVGREAYPPMRHSKLLNMIHTISYLQPQVKNIVFWYHPMHWKPAEASIPWRVSVGKDWHFIIYGPTLRGFQALEKKFRQAMRNLPANSLVYDCLRPEVEARMSFEFVLECQKDKEHAS